MNIKFRIIFYSILFLINLSAPSLSATDIITKEATKIIKNLGIETAVKGKKLKEYFSGNTLFLSFEDKKKRIQI